MLSTVQTFFAAMAMNPDVQKLAQAELDSAVGPRRLPNLDDEPDLPYVNALIKECLRWRSVTPLGMAHKSMEENEYKGYRIPKGSIVVSNIWCVIAPLALALSWPVEDIRLTHFTPGHTRETVGSTAILKSSDLNDS